VFCPATSESPTWKAFEMGGVSGHV